MLSLAEDRIILMNIANVIGQCKPRLLFFIADWFLPTSIKRCAITRSERQIEVRRSQEAPLLISYIFISDRGDRGPEIRGQGQQM